MILYFIMAIIVFITIIFFVAKYSSVDDNETLALLIGVNMLYSLAWGFLIPVTIIVLFVWFVSRYIVKLARRK